jgi:hypothetical protein
MKLPRVVLLSLVVMLLVVTAPLVSLAQDATGRIFGTVYDQQGAVIPDAHVTVTNTATQITRAATTEREGTFQILALPIGTYKVTAEHAGFRTVVSPEQKLSINQSLRIDFKMEVGAESQTVDVGAEAAPVETVNPTLGQAISGSPRATTTTVARGITASPADAPTLSPSCSMAETITTCSITATCSTPIPMPSPSSAFSPAITPPNTDATAAASSASSPSPAPIRFTAAASNTSATALSMPMTSSTYSRTFPGST